MNIQYQNAVAGSIPPANSWLPGDMEPIGSGGFSIKKPNGKYLSIQPDGSYQDRDAIGPWEAFVPADDVNVLRVKPGPTFAIYYRYV